MHILFIHQNFPAQFGHIAAYLTQRNGFRTTYLSDQPPRTFAGVECIQYKLKGGATETSHFCARSFENAMWHSHAVYEALKARPEMKPDLVVAHSGFLSTIFLREIYDCPIVNYFEYFYRTKGADMDYRPDFPNPAINFLRARARNAVTLLALESCDLGYSPTRWQRSLFPRIYQDKIRTIFDGIDTTIWKPLPERPTDGSPWGLIPPGKRIVTYVSRGFESIR